MSMFEVALKHTLKIEGNYSDDPEDPGGETFAGIARNYWPDWPGWNTIDSMKERGDVIGMTPTLKIQIASFYRVNFYNRVGGDLLTYQKLATEMFEQAVNLGTDRAAEHLQEALNLLNRNGKSWPEILVDGKIGPATIRTLAKAFQNGEGLHAVFKMVNALQAEYYLERIRARPVSEKYIRGWLGRT